MNSLRARLARSRWWRRARAVVLIAAFVLFNPWTAASAAAKQGSTTPTLWSWMAITDTHGYSAWGYGLSLNQGGWTDAGKAIFGGLASMLWSIYQFGVIFCFWFIDWVLSFAWLPPLVAPLRSVAAAVADILARLGVVPTLMLVAALTVALLIARGRWATGLYELGLTLVVLAVSTGALAHPVDVVAGQGGMLYQAKDAGLELAAELDPGGTSSSGQSPEQAREEIVSELVDVFLRTPHQLVNYGMVLDGTKCEKAYNTSIEGIPRPPRVGEKPSAEYTKWAKKHHVTNRRQAAIKYEFFEPRKAVEKCNPEAGQIADNPGAGMTVSALSLMPAAGLLLILSLVMAGMMFFFTVLTLWCAIKFIWSALIALCGGSARGGLWQTISRAVMAMFGVAVFSVVLVGYLIVVNQTTAQMSQDTVMGAIILLDLLIFVGIVLFWKLRKQLAETAEKMARMLSKRPSAFATTLPKANGMQLNRVDAYQAARMGRTATSRTAAGTAKTARAGAKVGGAVGMLGAALVWAGGAKLGRKFTGGSNGPPSWASPYGSGRPPSSPPSGPSSDPPPSGPPRGGPPGSPSGQPPLTGAPARAHLEARTSHRHHGGSGMLPPRPRAGSSHYQRRTVQRPHTPRYEAVRHALEQHTSSTRASRLENPGPATPTQTPGGAHRRPVTNGSAQLIPPDQEPPDG
ncbi:MAG: hypothetical protein ACRDP4_02730 [Nocardioidaceae bacterium]